MPTMDSYPAQTTPNDSDYHVVNDGVSGETKKITRDDYLSGAPLPANTVTTAAITDATVTAAKLATNAITLGYTQITSNFATSSGTFTDVTSLSVTVTIPAGGRRVKITAFGGLLSSSVANGGASANIYDVTAGAQLATASGATNASGDLASLTVLASHIPSSGSRTYKVQLARGVNAQTVTWQASATNPIFILVEAI